MSDRVISDYLHPSLNQIRHSIKGIDDSYNNAWDVLAELLQNSVDAIRLSENPEGNIYLEINCPQQKITITDNGVGIDKDELPNLLKPFSTNKQGTSIAIGEKGVGLKFVIFNSSLFTIRTGNHTGSTEAIIRDAYNWKNRTDETPLLLHIRDLDEQLVGTVVCIENVNNDIIFNLRYEQLEFLLRTKTAAGSTKNIWGSDKQVTVHLSVIDINGTIKEGVVPFKYQLVTDYLKSESKISLDEFLDWCKTDRTDAEKTNKLKDKVIYKTGSYLHNSQRDIKYFACFVPKRRVWNDLSVQNNLIPKEFVDDDLWNEQYYFVKLNYGITVSVKGMPTGISIDHPSTGYAGYWSNIFIIFEDPTISFDIGRKSIHGRTANIHKEYAKRIFTDFVHYITKYVSGDAPIDPPEWDRDEIFSDIDSMIDLNHHRIKFLKTPTDQEASVAAIFYECIGNGIISNLIPLISGYRSRYDLYAKWGKKRIVIEFKSRLKNIGRDFNDLKKMFDEIDCIVCWEVTDTDRQALFDLGINVEPIVQSEFAVATTRIPHSSHIMNISGFVKPIYVIDLKTVLAGS